MDHRETAGGSAASPASQKAKPEASNNPVLDEFFENLKQQIPRTRPDPNSMAAALRAIQDMELESGTEEAVKASPAHVETTGRICTSCGNRNRETNKFCAMCGTRLAQTSENLRPAPVPEHIGDSRTVPAAGHPDVNSGQHHYHHHYHHHFFQSSSEAGYQEAALAPRLTAAERPIKETGAIRAPLSAPAISRAEATVRKLTQDLALACNTKQLDDLVDLYSADALLMRSNTPPVRGSAAIREFFFTALDSGLGEVELETLRVETVGDVAYEAGRFKVLVPFAMGKRREERGKYLIIYNRRAAGEWKILSDCWSSDLTLNAATEAEPAPPARPGIPRKSA